MPNVLYLPHAEAKLISVLGPLVMRQKTLSQTIRTALFKLFYVTAH